MGENSAIEWTDSTDNVIVVKGGGWWCRKVCDDPCCEFCYAEGVNNNSFFGGNHLKYEGQPPELELRRDIIARWKRQTKARKHFVMSLSDIFGEWVLRSWHFEILDGMLEAPLQIFQILTKRTNIALKSTKLWMAARGLTKAPANVWFGFTAGTQKHFDQRWKFAKQLAELGFTIFVSSEPLFEEIILPPDFLALGSRAQVIVGGESGKHARPMHPAWARVLRDQCVAAGVRFFFKQWGEWRSIDGIAPGAFFQQFDFRTVQRRDACGYYCDEEVGHVDHDEIQVFRFGKKASGRLLDGVEWSEFPEAIAT